MQLKRISSLTAIALVFLCSSALHAQSGAASIMHTAHSGNWYVRVTTTDQRTLEGRVTLLGKDTVFLTRTKVALADVATIERRVRSGGGALPGAAVAGTLLGLFGYAFVQGMCEGTHCGAESIGALAGGAAMGMTVGSTLGAMLAPGRVNWQRVYPSADSGHAELQHEQRATTDSVVSYSGPAFVVGGGAGLIWDDDMTVTMTRFGLQLSGTTRGKQPIELTAEAYALLAGGSGGILGTEAGLNFIRPNGDYLGGVVGLNSAAEDRVYSAGVRFGRRPHSSIGIRTEGRAELFWNSQDTAFAFSVSLALESR